MNKKTFHIILGIMTSLVLITGISLYALGNQVNELKTENTPLTEPDYTDSKTEIQALGKTDAVFKNAKGEKIVLKDIRNKVIFINMWATWCPPCKKEMPSLNNLYNKLKSNPNIVFIMMDVDGKLKQSTSYIKEKGFSLPNYIVEGNLPEEFSTNSIPTTIIIDKSGKMVTKHIGGVDFDHPEMLPFIQNLLK
ncbi:redoxin family protein [Sphingobacterium spiritivorum ATCC 33300]|uniref:Redoxin family protein n=1 Tax=Sphingobacterium spiritivorum ATCC 33300 TaxID=525372 RepID=C2G0L6_SPHSI|nr:TlpA disulfide reductase family protein [Sphingobacterium spiritivorum]EEI91396.1 redoxin family protein [Sphingobacterium spiritivorum ATCC 33300]QQS97491.1 TlpA family protein disulfide reductase [Sphingobacterium spiritivorum]